MRKIAAIAMVFFIQSVNAQKSDLYFYSKNNKKLGLKSEMIPACVKGLSVKNKKLYADPEEYCDCYITTLGKYLTASKFKELSKGNSKWFQDKLKDDKDSMNTDLANCYWNNASEFGKAEYEKKWKKYCTKILSKQKEKEVKKSAETACDCIKNALEENGYNIAAVPRDIDKDYAPSFNEIMVPCIDKIPKEKAADEKISKDNKANIEAGPAGARIPLIKSSKIARIKIVKDGIEYYFILDSGASDVLINTTVAKEWQKKKILQSANSLGSVSYTIANGKKEKCKRYLVHGLELGPYTLNNIVVAVSKEPDVSMLLGKSLLDKFKIWSIDNTSSELVVEK